MNPLAAPYIHSSLHTLVAHQPVTGLSQAQLAKKADLCTGPDTLPCEKAHATETLATPHQRIKFYPTGHIQTNTNS